MFDIYEALKSGKSADEIAQFFVDELNASLVRIEAEKQAEAQKTKDATALADHFNNFVKMYYPKETLKYTSQDVIDLIEASLFVEEATANVEEATSAEDALDKFSDVLTKFFDKYNI